MTKAMKTLSNQLLSEQSFIQEGAAPRDDLLLLACTIGDDFDEDSKNELIIARSNHAIRFRASREPFVSVSFSPDGRGFVMGERGTVIAFDWRKETESELKSSRALIPNAAAAERGPMRRTRVIDDIPYCVGSFGQVFQIVESAPTAFPFLDIYDEPVTIKDICGANEKDLIAVSQHGVAARFDGKQWVDLQLPTTMKISSATRLDSGKYALVGSAANLFIGAGSAWEHHVGPHPGRDYYGVAGLGDLAYLGHTSGIDVFDGVEFREVECDDESGLEFAFLARGENYVWSMSGQTVGRIKGGGWETLVRPNG